MRRSFLLPVLTLTGTIIGAGVFALPHLFARLGTTPASLLFALFVLLVTFTHVSYVDVVLEQKASHRLPGYAKAQLGKRWGALATVTHFVQVYGSHVIYLLLGSAFLQSLALPAGGRWMQMGAILLVWFLGATAVRGNLRKIASLEAFATALMLTLFLVASGTALGAARPITLFTPHLSWEVFGVFLFALSGLPVVAEVVELSERNRSAAKWAAGAGTVLAGAVMWLFALSFARAGGTLMTQDPGSLLTVLPPWGVWMVPVLGLLAIGTSYITTAEDLRTTWSRDYGASEGSAWALTMVPPLLLALSMHDGFLLLATLLGTLCGGINGVLIGMMRTAIGEGHRQRLMIAGGLLIAFIYAFGLAGQLTEWLFV
jgi:amino acid permease